MYPELRTVDGHQRVTLEWRLAHPSSSVWRSISEPPLLSRWHPATITALDPVVGGALTLDYGAGAVTTGRVTAYDAGRMLAWVEYSLDAMERESDNLFQLELTEAGDGCVLTLAHEFDDRAAAASYAAGWESCLDVLADGLAGRTPGPAAPSIERHQYYTRAFGLGEPIVHDGAVLVERQLMMVPSPTLWQALAPAGAPALEQLVPSRLGAARVVEAVAGTSVTLDLGDDSRVRWDIGSGPGGARLLVTHSRVSGDVEQARALWRTHIDDLVELLIASVRPGR